MTTVEEEIWNIFSYYAMAGNPNQPVKLRYTSFLKFAKDILISDVNNMTETRVLPADIHIIFTHEIKQQQHQSNYNLDGKDKLDFEQFLSCLVVIGECRLIVPKSYD